MQMPHQHLSLSKSHWIVSLCHNLHAVGVMLLVHQQANLQPVQFCDVHTTKISEATKASSDKHQMQGRKWS
jgi:hypothetical protein